MSRLELTEEVCGTTMAVGLQTGFGTVDFEGAFEAVRGFSVLAGIMEYLGQMAQIFGDFDVVGAPALLIHGQDAAVERFGLGQIAGLMVKVCEIAQADGQPWILGAKDAFFTLRHFFKAAACLAQSAHVLIEAG